MRIIAIDPGYERLGVAILEKNPRERESLVYSECFQTDKALPHDQRLGLVATELDRVIALYAPQALCLETLFFSVNQKTATKVAEVRGVILAAAARHGLKVYEYGPGQIKVAVTGHGKSDKKQVIAMIPRLIDVKKGADAIRYDDEYDAIAVGLTCFACERLS
ncbi:MAG TPA: crossover junction endodeoxyribonuclease RuvC [Candidatus Paceibacterota bacterium]|nr:crossover junction endodeoxyribonuclease RuvC [Candidatus Paceibacterota bacterium]